MHDEVIRILSRAQVNANRTGHSFPAETLDVPLHKGDGPKSIHSCQSRRNQEIRARASDLFG